MQQLLSSLPQAASAGRSRLQTLPAAWPSLLPQRRRSEPALICRARKSRTELAAPEVSSPTDPVAPSCGGNSASPTVPSPEQQHVQPPYAGAQQQEQADGRDGAVLNRLCKSQQPQRQQKAVAPPRHGANSSSSSNSGTDDPAPAPVSSACTASMPAAAPAAGDGKQVPAVVAAAPEAKDTQLIFRLERRGDGWGEEILPHLVVEQRPLGKKKRAYSRPDPWKEGSLELYLVECGVPPGDVDRVVTQAVAWRVTPGGRSLIDRRRRSRVERNVRLVVEHLELECGVPFGPHGIAAILARCPEIMLCKPTTNDRWDRRAVELSAFLLRNGHCNVPEDWEDNPELGLWVKRQRIARAAGQISEERLSILQSMGFAFGEVAQLTEEWEHRFDQLVDWMLWHNENHQRFSWLGADWGARGGITARELALWTTLQREYRARGLLPGEALSRFEAIGIQWDTPDGTPAERDWISWFGRLLYVIERHNTMQPTRQNYSLGRPKVGRPRGITRLGESACSGSGGGALVSSSSSMSNGEMSEGEDPGNSSDEEDEELLNAVRRGSAAVTAARLRLQAEMAGRRAALATADLRSEPGLCFWLARQRRRWRAQELPGELALMLQLAGVQLDPYSPVEWQGAAHTAAALLKGSQIRLDPRRQQQAAAAARVPLVSEGGSGPEASGSRAEQIPEAAALASTAPPEQQVQQLSRGCPSAGSRRLRVARWVQTQQALFAESKLSAGQLRYLAFLGITWVLSEEVYNMSEARWQEWHGRLAAVPRPLPCQGELWEWLQHQRGLHALGWLPRRRRRGLEALEVRLDTFDRCAAEEEWDRWLSELLAFRAEHGHCHLLLQQPGSSTPAAAGATWWQDAQQQQRWAPLVAWLAEQHRLLAAGRLPLQQATQLAAIGAAPLPPRVGPPPTTAVSRHRLMA